MYSYLEQNAQQHQIYYNIIYNQHLFTELESFKILNNNNMGEYIFLSSLLFSYF